MKGFAKFVSVLLFIVAAATIVAFIGNMSDVFSGYVSAERKLVAEMLATLTLMATPVLLAVASGLWLLADMATITPTPTRQELTDEQLNAMMYETTK